MTLAKAFVTGVVAKSPEKRFTQNDLAIVGFSVGLDDNPETLVRVVAFGTQAENIATTVAQGDRVAIDGTLQINTFKMPNGKDKKVYEINATSVEKISASSSIPAQNSSESIVKFNDNEIAQDLIDEDEIPF